MKVLSGNALKHGAGEFGSRVPLVFLELHLAGTLGPAIYGLWSMLQTAILYGNFLHLGVVSSLTRKEPSFLHRGDRVGLTRLRAAAYGFQIAVVVIALIILGVISQSLPNIKVLSTDLVICSAFLITVLLQQFQITAQASAINEYKVAETAKARIIFAVTFLFLGVLAARTASPLLFLVLAWSGALAVSLWMLFAWVPSIRVRPQFDATSSRIMLFDGFPIFVQGLMRLLLSNMDKLCLWLFAPAVVLGVYALGTVGAALIAMLSAIVVRVSLPTLLRKLEDNEQRRTINEDIEGILTALSSMSFVMVLAAAFFAPAFIHLVLPEYDDGIWTMTVLACVGALTGLSQAGADIVMSLGQKRHVLVATMIALACQVTLIPLTWLITESPLIIAYAVLTIWSAYAFRVVFLSFRAAGTARKRALSMSIRQISIMAALVLLAPGLSALQRALVIAAGEDRLLLVAVNGGLGILFFAVMVAIFRIRQKTR